MQSGVVFLPGLHTSVRPQHSNDRTGFRVQTPRSSQELCSFPPPNVLWDTKSITWWLSAQHRSACDDPAMGLLGRAHELLAEVSLDLARPVAKAVTPGSSVEGTPGSSVEGNSTCSKLVPLLEHWDSIQKKLHRRNGIRFNLAPPLAERARLETSPKARPRTKRKPPKEALHKLGAPSFSCASFTVNSTSPSPLLIATPFLFKSG